MKLIGGSSRLTRPEELVTASLDLPCTLIVPSWIPTRLRKRRIAPRNTDRTMRALRSFCACAIIFGGASDAFTTHKSAFSVRNPVAESSAFRTKPVYFFGRNKKETGEDVDKVDEDGEGEKKRQIPFFGRTTKPKEEGTPGAPAATVKEPVVSNGATGPMQSTPPKDLNDPVERAKALRAQAERARLEAERMDAELTLSKIEKLERQLKVAKTKGESIEEIQRQLDNLQAKLRGEPPKPAVAKEPSMPKKRESTAAVIEQISTNDIPSPSPSANGGVTIDLNDFVNKEDLEETKAVIDGSPGFVKRLLASVVELDFDTLADINTTELAARLNMASSGDFSFSKYPKPEFTEGQIEEAIRKIEKSEVTVPDDVVQEAAGDKRKMARYVLEMEYFIERRLGNEDRLVEVLSKAGGDDEVFKEFINALNASAVDQLISSSYPKCMRKENAQEPTLAQVQAFASNVLPKAKFSATSKPEKVLGGYIVTGTYKYAKGDELIDAIDKELERAGLADKMTVLLADDFTALAKAQEEEYIEIDIFGSDEASPILYITSPDLVRESKPVQLSLVTGLGIASSWYLSIYPFLLNPALSQRVEEQLAVADAGMSYDLEWLTDLSVPLFFYFIGIQLLHELGHRIAAGLNEVKLSPPTLVPSLVTGITSSVTSFKSLPKNKDAMFDIAASGPLLGAIASIAAVAVGSQLTLSSDPATLPSLPVDILRQSMLGGGIIDTVIKGSLFVPDGAPSAGLMVSLHPLAVAGYISLIVNALAMLPVGTTDGGRVALSLFGRNTKVVLGWLTMTALLFTGILGSDLFLFYFAFVIAFQTGNEVPARNEIDELSLPRVALGALTFALAFLTLIPIQ